MINKTLELITKEDIVALLESGTAESKTLEYKRQLPVGPDESRKILRVICSLANTNGGDLIYGVEEHNGVPQALPGIDATDEDGIRLRVENSIRSNITPRPNNVQLKFVPSDSGRSFLVIRVKKSWNGPHRLEQDGHFYARNSAGCYTLDVGELRQAFSFSSSVVDRIRQFRVERLIKIEEDTGPVGLVDGLKVVLHMIPLSAFAAVPAPRIELEPVQLHSFDPIGVNAVVGGFNFEGYYRYFGASREQCKGYTQVFRSGVIESTLVFTAINQPKVDKPVLPHFLETKIVECVNRFKSGLSSAGVDAPYFFFLSFLNVQGSKMVLGGDYFPAIRELNERATTILTLPEVVAETSAFESAQALKPLFDAYWNAYGYERSLNYDESGKWAPRP